MARFSSTRPARPAPRAPVQRHARPRGRPPTISDDDILEVARAVFLERGIQATTEEVAERAGVSEGTVFRRFKSKDALFRAAMRFSPEAVPAFIEGFVSEVGQGDLRERLLSFATRLLELGRTAVPMMMMSWSNPSGDYHFEKMSQRTGGYRKAFHNVCRFFERELEARELDSAKAELFARIFMGSLHHYCMAELFLGANVSPSREDFTRGLVDVLLKAAGYTSQQAPARRGGRRTE